MNWTDLSLSPEMLSLIEKAGFKNPSPVQEQAIPLVLEGQDVLVSSQTGSGKTAAFVIPTVERFKNKNGTYVLALSPTREIAQQTGAVFEEFGAPFGLKTVVCIGGASLPVEKEALSSSPHIIVATPGRLADHLERGNVWLDFIQCLIFDEADRMLDMGFAKQIETITSSMPKERQTLMFSATFAPSVEKLARSAMREPKQVTIEKTEASKPQIDERLFWLPEGKKIRELMRILREEEGTVFVFTNAKERVYQVWRQILDSNFDSATYIHSDLPQEKREEAIAEFKAGKFRVLVATDVAGRGIDVDDVAHVVNWDVPFEAEDYVHRIGRTGRRGREGRATTFAVPGRDDKEIRAIEKLLGKTAPPKPEGGEEGRRDRDRRPGKKGARGPRNQRPREKRPRDDRPRDKRPRDQKAREQRPRNQRPPRQQRPGMPEQVALQQTEAINPKKSGGLVGWVKKIFGR